MSSPFHSPNHLSSELRSRRTTSTIYPHASLNELLKANRAFEEQAKRTKSLNPKASKKMIVETKSEINSTTAICHEHQHNDNASDGKKPSSISVPSHLRLRSKSTGHLPSGKLLDDVNSSVPTPTPSPTEMKDTNKQSYSVFQRLLGRSRQSTPATIASSNTEILMTQPNNTRHSNLLIPTIGRSVLGDVYSNYNAQRAYKIKQLNSQSLDDSQRLRVLFANQTSQTLILCWVGFDHKLMHYYKLRPSSDIIIKDSLDKVNTSSNMNFQLEGGMHSEQTSLGHCFVLGTCPMDDTNVNGVEQENDTYYDDSDDDDKNNKSCWSQFQGSSQNNNNEDENIPQWDKTKMQTIIGAYRPRNRFIMKNREEDDEQDDNTPCLHMVTITEELGFRPKSNTPQLIYHLSVCQCKVDNTPLDTSNKVYVRTNLSGWQVYLEKGLFSGGTKSSKAQPEEEFKSTAYAMKKLRERLVLDLAAAGKKLPVAACKLLKSSTPIYINKSQCYGPKAAPIHGKGMCFHPEEAWLIRNGMSKDKCGGIELYQADEYLEDCDLWHGTGGVMIHELSHAL